MFSFDKNVSLGICVEFRLKFVFHNRVTIVLWYIILLNL